MYIKQIFLIATFIACLSFLGAHAANAATLGVSPSTGVYTSGSTFTVRVTINTSGSSINAAEGALSFNTNELSVVNVSRATSIFNLWTTEPTFSNSQGTISFGGGSPSGYSGSGGTIMSITFRALSTGTLRLSYSSGSVLAADGRGTNILSNMSGGTYTVNAVAEDPDPEQVYMPEANTPERPMITSSTHADPTGWYTNTTAELSWDLPTDVTAVRTLLDNTANSIPTKVYEDPIDRIELTDLQEGVQYLHLQFRNAEGWGKIAHYRLAIDITEPRAFTISHPENHDPADPRQMLLFEAEDEPSGIQMYLVSIDNAEPVEFVDEENTGLYTLPDLDPGRHSIIAEAVDHAGNKAISTFNFEIVAFEKPRFTEYPERINEEVIPVIRGETRPRATVSVTLTKTNDSGAYEAPITEDVVANDEGVFTYIPPGTLSRGVYELSATAVDEHGAKSQRSDPVRIVVEPPGYVKIGGLVVSVLSVLIPMAALLMVLTVGVWYFWSRFSRFRNSVRKEVKEAEASLANEFDDVIAILKEQVQKVKKSKHGKLSKAQQTAFTKIEEEIDSAEKRIQKEIQDIDDLIDT